MNSFQVVAAVIVGAGVGAICHAIVADTPSAPLGMTVATSGHIASPAPVLSAIPVVFSGGEPSSPPDARPAASPVLRQEAALQPDQYYVSFGDYPVPPVLAAKRDLSYLAYYPYAEIPPDVRPADLVLASLRNHSAGTPVEEIKRAAEAFGLDFSFMKAVARIESGFDPTQRTGSYIGLFQLSRYEFALYGSGDITNARDNAVAAAYKFITEATLFELDTHRNPTFSDLYLIHQQGWQGAAEHVAHPERIAWRSMCATDEGKEKGEAWCKRAIWQNTLPAVKLAFKSVDNLTSGDFVAMWRERVDSLYARYAAMPPPDARIAKPRDATADSAGLRVARSHDSKSHGQKSRDAKAHGEKSRMAKSRDEKTRTAKAEKSHAGKAHYDESRAGRSRVAKLQDAKSHVTKSHAVESPAAQKTHDTKSRRHSGSA